MGAIEIANGLRVTHNSVDIIPLFLELTILERSTLRSLNYMKLAPLTLRIFTEVE